MKTTLLFLLLALVGCGEKKENKKQKTLEETNALIIQHLTEAAPAVMEMEKGIDQVYELLNLLHNATPVKNDSRIIGFSADMHLWHSLNDQTYGTICGGYALLLFDSLRAIGYETRMVQMFTTGIDNHIAAEVLIGAKWIALDATFNVVFKDDLGELMSFGEIKERVENGGNVQYEVIGPTHFPIANYPVAYELYMANVRALPVFYRGMPYLHQVIDGEERY